MTERRQPAFGVRYWMTKLFRPEGMTWTPKPRSSLVPHESLPNLDPNLRRFRSLEAVDDPLGELFRSHINHLLEI